jgi:hypothetical protein
MNQNGEYARIARNVNSSDQRLKIITSLSLRFPDFQRKPLVCSVEINKKTDSALF